MVKEGFIADLLLGQRRSAEGPRHDGGRGQPAGHHEGRRVLQGEREGREGQQEGPPSRTATMGSPEVPIDVDPETGIWRTDGLPMIYLPRHFLVNNHVAVRGSTRPRHLPGDPARGHGEIRPPLVPRRGQDPWPDARIDFPALLQAASRNGAGGSSRSTGLTPAAGFAGSPSGTQCSPSKLRHRAPPRAATCSRASSRARSGSSPIPKAVHQVPPRPPAANANAPRIMSTTIASSNSIEPGSARGGVAPLPRWTCRTARIRIPPLKIGW